MAWRSDVAAAGRVRVIRGADAATPCRTISSPGRSYRSHLVR